MNKKHIIKIGFLCLAALILAFLVFGTVVYVQYMQLLEIGNNFVQSYWTDLNVSLVMFAVVFFVFTTLTILNFATIRSNVKNIPTSTNFLKKFPIALTVSLFISAILSVICTSIIADKFLPFLTSEWFNLGDPIFHKDVGYYIFQRPYYMSIISSLEIFTGTILILTILSYVIIYGGYDFYKMKNILRDKRITAHALIDIAVFFLVKVVSYQFIIESVLFKHNNEHTGASYVDINVWVKYYKLAPIILIIAVILALYFISKSSIKGAITSVIIYPIAFIIATVVATFLQTNVVSPNELDMEKDSIASNIKFTQSAYNINEVSYKNFDIKNNLTGEKIMQNLDIINNISLNSEENSLNAAETNQKCKKYYHFNGADTVFYNINGVPSVVATAAREMMSTDTKNYNTKRMEYIHGSGIVMNSLNRVNSNSEPYYYIKDLPTRSTGGAPLIKRTEIYYGEGDNDYAVSNTKINEIDEGNTTSKKYNGNGGIIMNMQNRFLFAIKFGDPKLLFSKNITMQSKLILNRNIINRVKKVAPFLMVDDNPYIVADDNGTLKWIVDCYTTSEWYPYSEYSGDYNYIRNSVKAVIDAYDGTVKLYITDNDDPIVKSYYRIYPYLFEAGALPQSLIEHVKYPKYYFSIQANILKQYHLSDVDKFYHKTDLWTIAKEKTGLENQKEVSPSYCYNAIDGKSNQFRLMLPFTMFNQDNLSALLIANCNWDDYGKLTVYNFEDRSFNYGPYQIENRIDSDAKISQNISLWEQNGEEILRGNIVIVPIENSLLYIEPIYSVVSKKMQIKQIVLAYDEKIVCADTLDGCLKNVFGVNRPVKNNDDETIDEVISRVIESYDKVKQYSKENNWTEYGNAMSGLEYNIEELRGLYEKDDLGDNN